MPAGRLDAMKRKGSLRAEGKRPRSVLVITYGGHGDVLLTTPLITSLKRAYPEAMVDVYTQKGRGAMLFGNPDVQTVFEEDHRHGFSSYAQYLRRHTLRYDLAVSTRTSDRQVLFARAAGRRAVSVVPSRGQNRIWKEMILDGWVRRIGEGHEVDLMLRLVDLLGIERVLACRPPSDPQSEERLHTLVPFDRARQPYAVLNVTTRNWYKDWTAHGWGAVVRHFHSKGLRVILVGGSTEYDMGYAASLAGHVSCGITDLTGKTTFADAATLLRRCRIYVGLDTAMTHLSAVLNVPTVAIYGWDNTRYMPYHEAVSTRPYRSVFPRQLSSSHVRVLVGQCRCPPGNALCERRCREHSQCMQNVSPPMVTAALDEVLSGEGCQTVVQRGARRAIAVPQSLEVGGCDER